MQLLLKIGLETDGDYSLLHEDNFDMRWDGTRYFGVFRFDDTDKETLYPYEDKSYLQFNKWWRANTLLQGFCVVREEAPQDHLCAGSRMEPLPEREQGQGK